MYISIYMNIHMHIFQFYIEVTGNKRIILNITELLLKVSSFLLQNIRVLGGTRDVAWLRNVSTAIAALHAIDGGDCADKCGVSLFYSLYARSPATRKVPHANHGTAFASGGCDRSLTRSIP